MSPGRRPASPKSKIGLWSVSRGSWHDTAASKSSKTKGESHEVKNTSIRKAAVSGVIAVARAAASPNGTSLKAGRKWPEAIAILGNGRKTNDRNGTAVEVAFRSNDLSPIGSHTFDLVGPYAPPWWLSRRPPRRCSSVTRRSQPVAEISTRNRIESLQGQRLDETRITMAETDRGIGSHHIDVTIGCSHPIRKPLRRGRR